MDRRPFIQALLVALLLLCGLNLAIGRLGRNAVPRVILREIRATRDLTHVFLGNSVVEAGVSTEAFTAGAAQAGQIVRPFNAGLGWSTAAEHAVLWEQVLAAGQRPKMVFYGFFDFMLHEEQHRDPWWSLAGNVAMAYYVDPRLAAHYHAPGSLAGSVFMQAVAHLALFTERSTFWGKVEQGRRWLSAQGMITTREGASPEAAPQDAFRAFEAKDAESFARRCRELMRDDLPFSPAVRDLIASARQSGARVCLVEMPVPPAHRHTFYAQPAWTDYKRQLKVRLAAEGVSVIEAADWVPEAASFGDSLHLNRTGAQQFSAHLGSVVSAAGFPPADFGASPAAGMTPPASH